MNPKDQPELNSLTPLPYPHSETNNVFTFVTDNNTKYALILRDDEDYSLDKDLRGPILSLVIAHISGEIGSTDPRIRATVISILRQTFKNYPFAAISYVCSTEDDQEYARFRTFRLWFNRHNEDYEWLEHHSEPEKDRVHAAAFWRVDHPHAEELRGTFVEVFTNK